MNGLTNICRKCNNFAEQSIKAGRQKYTNYQDIIIL